MWNLDIHYRFHRIPPLAPILSHKNPVHTLPSYFLFPEEGPLNIIVTFVITLNSVRQLAYTGCW